jgi:hypothetical protein
MQARRLSDTVAFQRTGVVQRIEGPDLVVRTDGGVLRARRAVSCLVEAEPADVVLVAGDEAGRAWVLAVLERDGAATCLSVDGDLDVRARGGAVRVLARDAIDLVSSRRLSLSAPETSLSTAALGIMADTLSLVGDAVAARVEKARLESTVVETLAERIFQKAQRAYRVIEELDQLRARRVDYKGEQVMALHGGNTVVTANELVKVDGDQVHVG